MTMLNEREVAARLGISIKTLQAWRLTRKGPTYSKLGRAVRYHAEAVERFVAERQVQAAL